MFSLPDPDPRQPIKNNILWLLTRYNLDIDTMYRILSERRKMPSGKNRYQGIERALKRLQKEGWPIAKEIDEHGVAWYSSGEGFMAFVVEQLRKDVERIKKRISASRGQEV